MKPKSLISSVILPLIFWVQKYQLNIYVICSISASSFSTSLEGTFCSGLSPSLMASNIVLANQSICKKRMMHLTFHGNVPRHHNIIEQYHILSMQVLRNQNYTVMKCKGCNILQISMPLSTVNFCCQTFAFTFDCAHINFKFAMAFSTLILNVLSLCHLPIDVNLVLDCWYNYLGTPWVLIINNNKILTF